jgi:hypothetical protein
MALRIRFWKSSLWAISRQNPPSPAPFVDLQPIHLQSQGDALKLDRFFARWMQTDDFPRPADRLNSTWWKPGGIIILIHVKR